MLSVDTLPNSASRDAVGSVSIQSNNSPSAVDASSFITRLDQDNRLQIDAKVNGVPIEFQLDTGASHTILTTKHARLAAVAVEGQTRLAVIGGTITAHYGTTDTFIVAGNRIMGHRVLIVDGLSRSLIGMDTVIRLDAPTLSIRIPRKKSMRLAGGD